jgi:hypothetical protein
MLHRNVKEMKQKLGGNEAKTAKLPSVDGL